VTLEVVTHFVLEFGLCRETKMARQQPFVSQVACISIGTVIGHESVDTPPKYIIPKNHP
jgi:hypothetical protein